MSSASGSSTPRPSTGAGSPRRGSARSFPEFDRSSIVVATKVGRLLRPITFAAKTRRVLVESLRSGDLKRIGGDAVKITRRLARGRSGVDVQLGAPFDRDQAAMESYYDFSYDGVMRSFEESLRRLRLERVDMLYIHDPDHDHDAALDGAFKALDRLRSDNVVGAIGVGMNQTAMLVRFAREAPFDCFLAAGRYTLLDQEALDELIPECGQRGISLIVGGVYNSGILANPTPGATFNYTPRAARRAREGPADPGRLRPPRRPADGRGDPVPAPQPGRGGGPHRRPLGGRDRAERRDVPDVDSRRDVAGASLGGPDSGRVPGPRGGFGLREGASRHAVH